LTVAVVVFLRKIPARVKFVEQGFVPHLLVWWNDDWAACKLFVLQTPQLNHLNYSNRPARRMASRLTGIAGTTIQTG
jgi:hypothetical protein